MSASIRNRPSGPEAKALEAAVVCAPGTSFIPKTKLGRRLWSIRQRIVASGQPLLDWEGIESELLGRTGEASQEA
jgi:hypothetical protein